MEKYEKKIKIKKMCSSLFARCASLQKTFIVAKQNDL